MNRLERLSLTSRRVSELNVDTREVVEQGCKSHDESKESDKDEKVTVVLFW